MFNLLSLRYTFEQIQQIANYLLEKTHTRPTIGIICGSGLGGLAESVEDRELFPYHKIPSFPVSTGTYYHELV